MPAIGTFGLMSEDGKRSVGHRPQATAPILNSTFSTVLAVADLVVIGGIVLQKSFCTGDQNSAGYRRVFRVKM